MENLTPMLKQYRQIKNQYKDCILFFRLGDFYEMFYEDAKIASGILDLVLTSRGTHKTGKIPMCGVPYHAADSYIAKLIKAGLKVAICEQVQDPALAKGLVERKVVRIISSGTFIDETSPETRYIVAIFFNKEEVGLAFTDNTSGVIMVNQYPSIEKTVSVISKLSIYECLYPQEEEEKINIFFNHPLIKNRNIAVTPLESWWFNPEICENTLKEHFHTSSLRGFGINGLKTAIGSAGALLTYLKEMNQKPLEHIDKISIYTDTDFVFISPSAVYGLELQLLFRTIDNTLTSMGKRLLQFWVYHPLKNPELIRERQHAIKLLKENPSIQERLKSLLKNTPDIEKIITRMSCGYTHPKDLLALRNVLIRIPQIQQLLNTLPQQNKLLSITPIEDIENLLTSAINPQMPISNPVGQVIRKGYNRELDTLREIKLEGQNWLKNLQAKEINRTGISSLKIGFNKVFGYYIEVTKPNLHLVPSDYIRKQTLVNAERFITPELKEFEEKILHAEEKISVLENEIIQELQNKILKRVTELHDLGKRIATIDALYSLSIIATNSDYVLPKITEQRIINISDGRHPVVENNTPTPFIPNSTLLDDDNHLLIITGPNMAGKSTYIRQVALLVILAQIGSYIPAKSAEIGIVDKIFTRIGAHDEITKGQSTFMVEMTETAQILNNLSERSLVILDEIGRGTSTFDGLSLAWAIGEYLGKTNIFTLFATHFHELTALAEEIPGVKNYNVAVKEWGEEIIFLHKIVPGSTDDSYGIYVAKLAGVPKEVILRAKQILTQLELHGNLKEKIQNIKSPMQLTLFNQSNSAWGKIEKELKEINIDTLTPLQALNKINEWKKKINELK